MYSLVFYVPRNHEERVKKSLFDAGAGQIGHYSHCCWEIPGKGQFLPLGKSNPHLGKTGKLCRVKEFRIEMVVEDKRLPEVISALLGSHPYEVPAYHYFPINKDLLSE